MTSCQGHPVDRHMQLADQLGLRGTPKVVYENGEIQPQRLVPELENIAGKNEDPPCTADVRLFQRTASSSAAVVWTKWSVPRIRSTLPCSEADNHCLASINYRCVVDSWKIGLLDAAIRRGWQACGSCHFELMF